MQSEAARHDMQLKYADAADRLEVIMAHDKQVALSEAHAYQVHSLCTTCKKYYTLSYGCVLKYCTRSKHVLVRLALPVQSAQSCLVNRVRHSVALRSAFTVL